MHNDHSIPSTQLNTDQQNAKSERSSQHSHRFAPIPATTNSITSADIYNIIDTFPLSESRIDIQAALRRENDKDFILTASTGAGKSVVTPLLAALEMYERIEVYVPTREAARSLAQYVSTLLGTELGSFVGYRAGQERVLSQGADGASNGSYWSAHTRIVYSTYGVGALYEHYEHAQQLDRIVFLDEIHSISLQKQIVASALLRQKRAGADLKIVTMSATCDTRHLQNYFQTDSVIEYEGSRVDIVDVAPQGKMSDMAASYLVDGYSVLAFQSGKKDCDSFIRNVRRALSSRGHHVDGIPMFTYHSGTPKFERERVSQLHASQGPHLIAATDAAQQSLTLPTDVVLNNGEVLRKRTVKGVESLVLEPTSIAEDMQRRGRVGRIPDRPALYVPFFTQDQGKTKELYPVADSRRELPLWFILLSLAKDRPFRASLDEMMDPPKDYAIEHALSDAQNLGLVDKNENLTPRGKALANVPLDPYFAILIEHAREYAIEAGLSASYRHKLLLASVALAAISSSGYLIERPGEISVDRIVQNPSDVDIVLQLQLFTECRKLTGYQISQLGIRPAKLWAVHDHYTLIVERLGLDDGELILEDSMEKHLSDIYLRSVGPRIKVFQKVSSDRWVDGGGDTVVLSRLANIPSDVEHVCGIPFRVGKKNIVSLCLAFRPDQVRTTYPAGYTIRQEDIVIRDPIDMEVVNQQVEFFGDVELYRKSELLSEAHSRENALVQWYGDSIAGRTLVAPWGFGMYADELAAWAYLEPDSIEQIIRRSYRSGDNRDPMQMWERILFHFRSHDLSDVHSNQALSLEFRKKYVKIYDDLDRRGALDEAKIILRELELGDENELNIDPDSCCVSIPLSHRELISRVLYVISQYDSTLSKPRRVVLLHIALLLNPSSERVLHSFISGTRAYDPVEAPGEYVTDDIGFSESIAQSIHFKKEALGVMISFFQKISNVTLDELLAFDNDQLPPDRVMHILRDKTVQHTCHNVVKITSQLIEKTEDERERLSLERWHIRFRQFSYAMANHGRKKPDMSIKRYTPKVKKSRLKSKSRSSQNRHYKKRG